MPNEIKKMTDAFEALKPEVKESMGKLRELIEKSAMDPVKVRELIENSPVADKFHPDLANVEGMTSRDFAAIYKQMAEEVKTDPEKFEAHTRAAGMSADELAILFTEINGVVDQYPEVWESKEAAQLLRPENLSILVHAISGKK